MTPPIIDVQHIRKCYGNFNAVSGISFRIFPGEFFGLLGPNGAGKTTTIGMLTGLIPPTNGTIIIDGHDLKAKPDLCKSIIGLVPQDFAFYSTLNIIDNLTFFGRIYGLRGRHLRRRIEEVLAVVSLSNHTQQPVATFSNGMKRRLNIAIGLLNNPRIIFLDEPTVGVDAQSRLAIFESLKQLNTSGITIIYTTHYMEEAQTLCSRIAIMDRGQIIRMDTPSALIHMFGNALVKIEFSRKVDVSLYEQLKTIDPLSLLDDTGQWVLVPSAHPAQTIENILQLPEVKIIGIQSLDVSRPNLEDVFLHLTGHSLRDNEP